MIHHADFGTWADTYKERSFDHIIGDPPYLPRSQDNQRRGAGGGKVATERALAFGALTAEHRALWAMHIERLVRRWVLIFSDAEGAVAWADDLERAGLVYVRTMVWIRGDLDAIDAGVGVRGRKGSPQFTGDRPAVGHECMILAHARGKRLAWNGGGKAGVYVHNVVAAAERIHDAQKPLSLMRELVRDFTDPQETILDPWAGSGTTCLAARLEGRAWEGVEVDAAHAKRAQRRVEGMARP